MQNESIQTLAEAFASVLKLNNKSDEREIVTLTKQNEWPSDMPFTYEECLEVIRNSHGEMMPDDYKYQFLSDAIDAIAEHDGDIEAAQCEIEADDCTHDLLKWVASNLGRASFVDEYVTEYKYEDLITALSGGQRKERDEVFGYVREFLERKAEEIK